MTHTFKMLLNDEAGFIISAELMLIITLMFCGAVVGFAAVRDALVNELNDVSHAIGAVSQGYKVSGLEKKRGNHGTHAYAEGFGFNDNADDCDCNIITIFSVAGKDDPSRGRPE